MAEESRLSTNDSADKKFQNVFNVAMTSTKWKNFCSSKRKVIVKDEIDDGGDSGESYLLTEPSPDNKRQVLESLKSTIKKSDEIDGKVNTILELNRTLLSYVARISHKDSNENFDFSWIQKLVEQGADINTFDTYGQTILHEVARVWHVDVAQYLVTLGANVNCKDNYGRRPLHVAAAMDYSSMCKFLFDQGAKPEARTKVEKHTPLFFAARYDSAKALRTLIELKCKFDIVDYKNRTPLYVAAELDRSVAAQVLLEKGASAKICDCSGQPVIIPLISKMAPVAKIALDQFHIPNRAKRHQLYYLCDLDPVKKSDIESKKMDIESKKSDIEIKNSDIESKKSDIEIIKSDIESKKSDIEIKKSDIESKKWINVLDQIISQNQYELVMHKAIQKMINMTWNQVGWRVYGQVIFHMVYILSWSVFGVFEDWTERYRYDLPNHWYRIVIFGLAIILTFYQIIDEILEYTSSKKQFEKWKKWREEEISQDAELCHPRWKNEKEYYDEEIKNLETMNPSYWSDFWNYFDWLCYIMLMICISTHIADICVHSVLLARWHIRIMAVTIILLWLRLMKVMKSFSLFGPFIVVLGHMVYDVVRFIFLYLEFYIPFAFAFWMLFGGSKNLVESEYDSRFEVAENVTRVNADNFVYVHDMLFIMFRATLGQDLDYDNMMLIDHVMAQLLIGAWFALTSVICLNIFIALLSNTFQRVYDNAVANCMMQKAIMVMSIYKKLSINSKIKWHENLRNGGEPMKDEYDDDMTVDSEDAIQRATIEIRTDVNDLKSKLEKFFNISDENEDWNQSEDGKMVQNNCFNLSSRCNCEKELSVLHNEVVSLRDNFKNMQSLLEDIAIALTDGTSKSQNEEVDLHGFKNDRRLPSIMYVQPAIEVVEFQATQQLGSLAKDHSDV